MERLFRKLDQLLQKLEEFLEGSKHKKGKVRIWLFETGADVPITKGNNMLITLAKPIAPGFMRPFKLTPDEPVDVQTDGSFAAVTVVSGDSTIVIDPSSTASAITGFVRADGSIGDNQSTISCDGHIGPGEVPVTLDVAWSVAHPDATSLAFVEGGPDVPIPGVTPPAPAPAAAKK